MKTAKEEVKEKAAELVRKMYESQSNTEELYDAKQCALICVDEMESFYIDIMRIGSRKRKEIYYFNEIRNEIKKL
tara:strand:+ start:12843 stop:13067 length:225 start_codon:yes stop_codon:yes gene_type:complete